jgi:hypothetical protein
MNFFLFRASLLILVCGPFLVHAQILEVEKTLKTQPTDTVPGWKFGGLTGFNLAQTALFNWAAGGEKSFAVNGAFSLFGNFKKGKTSWDNSLDIGYGLLSQGERLDFDKLEFRKTDDKVDFLSKYGHRAFKKLYYAGLFNFKTQMAPGYKYLADGSKVPISNLLAPAYIVTAIGLDYKPTPYLSVFAAPITGKVTIVNDKDLSDAGAFGVEKGKMTNSEFGGYVRVLFTKKDFKIDFLENVAITTKLDLFSNYIKDPQNIVVNWETLIALKVNKLINVSISTHLIYDDKVKIAKIVNGVEEKVARIQFKELFGVGISYKF